MPDPGSSRLRISGTTHDTAETSLVVGHSRHPAADVALHFAVDLARRLHADLHVVHAVDLTDYPVDPDAADWQEQARRALAEQGRHVEALLAGFPLSWTYQAGHGDPVRLMADVAEETGALMIIVGSHGEGLGATFDRLVAGSVSRTVLRRQHRPVLIVPSGYRPTARSSPTGLATPAV